MLRADNSYGIGAWWPWGGIGRSVSLTVDPAVRIERQQVVAEPDLGAGPATVCTDVTLSNAADRDRTVLVGGAVTDLAGDVLPGAGFEPERVTVPAGGRARVRLAIRLAPGTHRLWTLDAPQLYRCTVQLHEAGQPRYAVSDRIGIRRVEVRGTGLHLNGERVRLNGYNRVADDRVGTATPTRPPDPSRPRPDEGGRREPDPDPPPRAVAGPARLRRREGPAAHRGGSVLGQGRSAHARPVAARAAGDGVAGRQPPVDLRLVGGERDPGRQRGGPPLRTGHDRVRPGRVGPVAGCSPT